MNASVPPEPFVWTGRIRFVDTDASTRIHYSSIFRHLEAAEHEFLRSIGQAYGGRPETGLTYPRVRVECDYLAPMRYDDAYAIEVAVDRVGTTSYTLAFRVTVAGKLAAQARITVVCIDVQTGRPHALPAAFADVLRQHHAPRAWMGAEEPKGRPAH